MHYYCIISLSLYQKNEPPPPLFFYLMLLPYLNLVLNFFLNHFFKKICFFFFYGNSLIGISIYSTYHQWTPKNSNFFFQILCQIKNKKNELKRRAPNRTTLRPLSWMSKVQNSELDKEYKWPKISKFYDTTFLPKFSPIIDACKEWQWINQKSLYKYGSLANAFLWFNWDHILH